VKPSTVPFLEALQDVSAGNTKIPQSEFLAAGSLAVVDQGQSLVAGYTDDLSSTVEADAPVIVFGDHTRALKYVDFPFTMGADGVKVLRARDGFDPKFVYRYLQSRKILSAGYSRHYKFLKEIAVPKPPLVEQRRIAAILDHADALREKRRQVLAHLDALTQSIFREMFGDPASNPRGWGPRRLGDLAAKFSDGPFGSNLKSSHYVPTGVRVVRLQNIGVGRFIDADAAFVTPEHFASLLKHECLPGDVLIGTLGDPNLRACIQPAEIRKALNKADCVQMRVDPAVAHEAWACWLLNMPGTLSLATSRMHGQTRTRIAMGQLRELTVPAPPIVLQREFAARLKKVEAERRDVRRAISAEDDLFSSLQSRAFGGEL